MSYIFESLGLCVKLTGSKLVEKVCSLLGVASVVRQKNDQVEEGGHFMLTMGEPREEFRGQQNLSVCLCVCGGWNSEVKALLLGPTEPCTPCL